MYVTFFINWFDILVIVDGESPAGVKEYIIMDNHSYLSKYPYLSRFEENPDRKVSFNVVKGLFKEIGTESFNLKFKWFCENCLPDSEQDPEVKHTVFSWIAKFFTRCDVVLSLKQPVLTEANINSFSEDLEDMEDYLTERAND